MPTSAAAPKPRDPATEGGPDHVVIESLDLKAESRLDLSQQIEEGLPYGKVQRLQEALSLPKEELAQAMAISPRTLARRKDKGTLTAEESDRLVQLGFLFDRAVHLFEGDAEAARDWFRADNRALGGRSPLDVAHTFVGAQEVLNLAGRLEHGVYS